MNCNLCKQELEAYHDGRLPEGIRAQVKSHLENCRECAAIYQMEIVANKVIVDEKQVQSNPFLSTRVMAEIEALELQSANSKKIPVYRLALKPVLITISIAAALLIGIMAGNIYQPSQQQQIPVELTYMDDAALESVNLVANN
jgi:predicted anti-sigma-YlaC factor YlaD